ncbi:MAG: HD domain-containing protein [Candidatus Nealsonbacteria bacterium]|nr:HD domain-containing protein [Candidatus Nealsonbacteria bacterium]
MSQYKNLEDYLFQDIHPEVEKLAMTVDGGYLTDHGPEHIRTVIDRASQMIGDPKDRLSPYEVYVLLVAIHLHDLGNIFGRVSHERRLAEIMSHIGTRLGNEVIELKTIRRIAEAHGGKDSDGTNADTIGTLQPEEPFRSEAVRMQLLAAILRFADELADDTDRASRLALELDRIPTEARIYHQYAKQLHSVRVLRDSGSIDLRFTLDSDVACRTFEKDGGSQYLLDEVYCRTMKMHVERIYCTRFMHDVVRLDAINVRIRVFRSATDTTPLEDIKYSLRESGYPNMPLEISLVVDDLKWSGEGLKRRLEGAREESHDGQ